MRVHHRKIALLGFLALWTQMALAPILSIRDIAPDFVYLIFVFFVFFLSREQVIWWSIGIGLVRDLLSNTFFGIETIALVGSVLFLGQIVLHFDREDAWVQIWATFLSTLVGMLIFLFFVSLVQDTVSIGYTHFLKSVLIAVYTSILIPIVFPILRGYFHISSFVKQYELF